MTEQEKRAQFFAKTGRIATSERIEYQAFLWGFEYGIESLRQQLADAPDEQALSAAYMAGSVSRVDEIRKLKRQLAAMTAHNVILLETVRFYAYGHHFIVYDTTAWDTVSGEPQNFQEDDANTAMVEDGKVARRALAATDADLAGLIVCEKEPVYVSAEDLERVMSLGFCKILVDNKARGMSELPLYRAKEQGK